MSATNLTKNLKLSQFVASDKPSWLGDVNGDNKKIDDGYGVLVGEISKANNTASSAKSQSDANTATLGNVNTELENIGNRVTALEAGGGTEQLEQRVNTLSTDVEELQTRADTFDDKIEEHGTKITTLTSKLEELEPKVNSNVNSITSLTSKTNSHSQSIQDLTANVSAVTTTANKADTNATSALRIGQDAYNKSVENENSISTISGKIEGKTSVVTNGLNFTATNTYLNDTSMYDIFDGNFHNISLVLEGSGISNSINIMNTVTNIGKISLGGAYPDSLSKQLAWNDTVIVNNNVKYILSASKTTSSSDITISLKCLVNGGTFSLATPITIPIRFNLY